jgi:hypothetical protein
MRQARGPVANGEIDVRHVLTDGSTPQPGDDIKACHEMFGWTE